MLHELVGCTMINKSILPGAIANSTQLFLTWKTDNQVSTIKHQHHYHMSLELKDIGKAP